MRIADIKTSKILWNSVLSMEGAKFMGIDISNFYLGTPMDRYEYMKMPLALFPNHIVKQYNLGEKAKNGFVYLELRKAIYGTPLAGSLADELRKEHLEPHGYCEVLYILGLWKHNIRPVQFSLVVDDSGVKYVRIENAEHLMQSLQQHYKLAVDEKGALYCCIKL